MGILAYMISWPLLTAVLSVYYLAVYIYVKALILMPKFYLITSCKAASDLLGPKRSEYFKRQIPGHGLFALYFPIKSKYLKAINSQIFLYNLCNK